MWPEIIMAGSSLLGGASSLLGGGDDDKETSSTSTTTTNKVPSYSLGDIQTLWNDFIGQLYPTTSYGYESGSYKDTVMQQWESAMKKAGNGSATLGDAGWDVDSLWANGYRELADFVYTQSGLGSNVSKGDLANALNARSDLTGGTATSSTKSSYEQLLAEDEAAKEAATNKYLQQSAEATKPYTDLLNQYIKQGNEGTGLFSPVSFGFGGQQMASFVPKSNRNLADQLTGYGKASTSANVGLLQDALNAATTYTPNAAKTDYIKNFLMPLATNLLMNSTQTTTGDKTATEEGDSNSFADTLKGALSGALAGGKIANSLGLKIG